MTVLTSSSVSKSKPASKHKAGEANSNCLMFALLLGSFFDSEHGRSTFLQNAGKLTPGYMA
jgi:hypothetical protein